MGHKYHFGACTTLAQYAPKWDNCAPKWDQMRQSGTFWRHTGNTGKKEEIMYHFGEKSHFGARLGAKVGFCAKVVQCAPKWYNVRRNGTMCAKVVQCAPKWYNVRQSGTMCAKVLQFV